nr:polyprotein [Mosavirus sp.]
MVTTDLTSTEAIESSLNASITQSREMESQTVKRAMELFQHHEYRVAGFKNFKANCWLNCVRQCIRLTANEGLFELFDQTPHTPDLVNDIIRQVRQSPLVKYGMLDPGYVEGMSPAIYMTMLGLDVSLSDYDGAIYQHEWVIPDPDLGYWFNAHELPVMILKNNNHAIVAAKADDEGSFWRIYDDEVSCLTTNWRQFGEPILGTAGVNMLQITPVKTLVSDTRPEWDAGQYWTTQRVVALTGQKWIPLQRSIIETIYKVNPTFRRAWNASHAADPSGRFTEWVQLKYRTRNKIDCAPRKHYYKICWDVDEDLEDDYSDASDVEWTDDEEAETQGGGQSKPSQGNVNGSQNQGTQIYNYYNNQYQNSVDMSSPYTSAGGTGGANTANSQHNNSSNSISGLFSSVLNAASSLAPLMLMDPDTEDSTQLPDRITEATEGNTLVSTQSSVGTLVGYHQLRSKHPVTSCADKPTIGGPSIERNFVQYVGTWSAAEVEYQYHAVPLPYGIDELGVFTVTASRHYTFKCGYKIQVQLNTSHFHAGCVGVFAVPEPSFLDNMNRTTTWQDFPTDFRPESLFVYPHQLINCRTNTSVDLIIPYMNFVPTSAYGYHCSWAIVVVVLTPLQIPTGASPVIDISMTVTPQFVVFNGLRQPQSGTQGYAGHIRENQAMFASTLPDTTTPVYGLGFNPNDDFVPGQAHNFLEWARTPCLMSNVVDGSIRGYFTASNTRSDTPLLQMDVTLLSDHMRYTTVGQLGYRYSQYRGSLNVMVTFTGAAMVKGKFLLVYTPPGAERPSNIAEGMQATYAVWDLGLQSSFDFVIPFISVSDYRLTASATTSTLSVDGWFTIFQYTALTYPANTPQRSDVLVFISAGEDLSYRNLIDVRRQGLDNAEEGASDNPTADADFEAHPVTSLATHTDLSFVFDRSWHLSAFQIPVTTAAYSPIVWPLSLGQMFKQNKELYWFLKALTYFKCDLEVALVPRICRRTDTGDVLLNLPVKLVAKFYPVGATLNTTATTPFGANEGFWSVVGPLPTMYGDMSRPITFAVPYTSPLSVIPTEYLGYADFDKTVITKEAPGASFGTVLMTAWAMPGTTINVDAFVRLRNFKGFVPRPFPNAGTTPAQTRDKVAVNADFIVYRSAHQEVTLAGDVELNPGPTVFSVTREEAQTQGLEQLFDFMSCGIFSEFKDTMHQVNETAHKANNVAGEAEEIVSSFKKMTDMATAAVASVTGWMKIVKKVLRAAMYAIIAYRCQADPVVIGCLTMDFVLGDPFDIAKILKDKLGKYFTTPAPPLVQTQGVSDANAVFNLLKNGEWALKMIVMLKDWFQRWVNQEMESPEKKLCKKMAELIHAIEVMERKDAEAQKCRPQCIPIIRECAQLARLSNRTSIANYCDAILKPYMMSSQQRTEPVVILLRGKPGQGKTVAATLLAQMISKTLVGCQSVYSLPPDSKHMDGYNGQAVVIMDDLGQNPDGMDFATFCQMVSTTQFVTPQASLTDKGTCFTSQVIIATTNLNDLRPVTIADPEAVNRRIFLNLDVSAVVKTAAGCLDLPKAMEDCDAVDSFDAPQCLTRVPKIFSPKVLALTEKREKIKYSLIDIYNKVMRELTNKVEMTDVLSGIVTQGIISTQETVTGTTATWEQEDGNVTKVYTLYDLKKEKLTADSYMQDFLVMVALAPAFITILKMVYGGMRWLISGKKKPEAEAEGVYSGMPKKQPKKLKKVVTQTTDKQKELQTRFVTITPEEIATTQGPRSDAETSLIERNTCPVNYMKGEKEISSLTALKLCNGKAMINKHQFDKDIWDVVEVAGVKIPRDDCQITGFVTQKGVAYDLYVLDVPGMQCRDITGYFTDDGPRNETLIGCCNSNNYKQMMWQGEVLRCVENVHTNDGILPKMVAYSTPTRAGFCGAPLTARRNGKLTIVAIHSAGNGVNGYGTLVTKKMIDQAVTQGIIYDERPGPFVAVNRKTQIKKSPCFPIFKPEAGTAVLSQYDRRLADGVNLDEALFEKHVADMDVLPREFEIAADMYAKELFLRIGKDNGPVSLFRALNGDDVTDPMDMDKAVGYPYCLEQKKRKDMVEILEKEKKIIMPTEYLVQETKKYFTGEAKPKFVTFLKDEVRSNEKIAQGKTRIVDASPFPYAVFGRMVLQNFMSNMMRHNGTAVGSAVGCDPDTDWTRYLFEMADRYVFDIDYKAFDSTHPTAMFELLKRKIFTAANGFDEELAGIFIDGLSDSDHVYESKHFRIRGGLPSGCPATSILNTVMNNIIIRAAIIGAYEIDTVDFDSFRMLAYGDDVIYATPQPILPQDLADWIHANTNYKMTPASKAGSFPSESTIWDVTFLKRAFKPDEDHGHLIRPVMSRKNLEQMLSFMRPGTFPDKVRSVAGLAVHCGAEDYEELAAAIESAAPGISFPAYSYMKACWYAKMV